MCGRFTRQYTWEELHELMELLSDEPVPITPSWNVAPTQLSPVIVGGEPGPHTLREMAWGLRTSWMEPGKPGPINARSETVASNAVFRGAYESRRCVVPISGFYEWQKTDLGKQPMYIRPLNAPVFWLAGLWEPGTGRDTFTVLTTDANERMAEIHDRMPVMLAPERAATWLDPATIVRDVPAYPSDEMTAHPVSTRVNSPRNDDASLIDVDEPERGLFG